jgi:tripartite-type tricarboxylate transporter receptor subunit TctC
MNILKKSLSVILFLCAAFPALADNTFKLIVPNPPGGSTDIVGRYIANILNNANIPTVVLNKSGAQGTIGAKSVAKTSNVQNTLLLLGTGPGLYAPLMMDPAPYNVLEEFDMVATIASDSIVIIVPGTSEIRDAKQLVQAIRKAEQPLRYGHGAMSQKFAGIVFLDKIKASAIEVPFNGASQTVLAVASETLEFGFVNYTEAKNQAAAGLVRIVGIASKSRHPNEPKIKTFIEQGIEFEHQAWFTVVAPKGMNQHTIEKLNAIITKSMENDKNSVISTEMIPMINNVTESKLFINNQYKMYQSLIENVKLSQIIKK